MSSSNVIYLRKWHEKASPFSESSNYFEPRNSYASTRETLELLGAIRRASSRVSALTVIATLAAKLKLLDGPPHAL